MTIPAGWYDDGSGAQRWWDGEDWTTHVAPDADEPVVAPPAPEPAPFVAPYTAPAPTPQFGYQPTGYPTAGYPTEAYPTTPYPTAAYPTAAYPSTAYPTAPYPNAPYPNGSMPLYGGFPAAQTPPPRTGVSPLGIAGLAAAVVATVLACIPLTALIGWALLGVALILSVVSQFLRGARWAGITGILLVVIGALVAFSVALVATGVDSASSRTDDATVETSPPTSSDEGEGEVIWTIDLDLGDCIAELESFEEEIDELTLLPCDQPHDSEVYHVFVMPGSDDFPGDDAITEEAIEQCEIAFEEFVGIDWYESAELDYWWFSPTEESWAVGDRTVKCLVYAYEGDVTGTLEGAAR